MSSNAVVHKLPFSLSLFLLLSLCICVCVFAFLRLCTSVCEDIREINERRQSTIKDRKRFNKKLAELFRKCYNSVLIG